MHAAADRASQEAQLLVDANALLRSMRPDANELGSVTELQGIATSLFIAVFESLFVVRLKDVVRTPLTRQEFMHNATVFLAGLAKMLPKGAIQVPPEITADAITSGSIPAIAYLVRFFTELRRLFEASDKAAVSGARHTGHLSVRQRARSKSRSGRSRSAGKRGSSADSRPRSARAVSSVPQAFPGADSGPTPPATDSEQDAGERKADVLTESEGERPEVGDSGDDVFDGSRRVQRIPRTEATGGADEGSDEEGADVVARAAAAAAVRRVKQEKCDARLTAQQLDEAQRRFEVCT